jgi:predicted permease
MPSLRSIVSRAAAGFTRGRADRDLDDEIQNHLDLLAAEYERRGLRPADARTAARRAFGGLGAMKEAYRDRLGFPAVEDLRRDVRHAIRGLRRTPAFTMVAVVTLALGIGANTAIFSALEALLLRPLPVREPESLVQLVPTMDGRPGAFSYPVVQELARTDLFDGLFGFSRSASFEVGEPATLEEVSAALVTGGYFETLGLKPAAGRLIRPDDDRPGAAPVAVLSHGYWERKFGGAPSVVGRAIKVEGVPVTIAGVSPAGFAGVIVGRRADVTIPIGVLPQLQPTRAMSLAPNIANWYVMARLRDDASAGETAQRLVGQWPDIVAATTPASPTRERSLRARLEIVPSAAGFAALTERFTRPLLVLMAMVTLVLLIACANVANLLLARTSARRRELATRLALGAGRVRVIRGILIESALLSAAGAVFGVAIAGIGSRTLLSIIQRGESTPMLVDVSPDGRVLAFTGALAVLTALAFGIVPAWRSASLTLPAEGRDWGRAVRSRSRLGPALVAAQVAVSLLLLVAGGLFVRTLQNLRTLDVGFRHDNVLTLSVSPPDRAFGRADFLESVSAAIRRLPGVEAVSFAGATPVGGGYIMMPFEVNGESTGADGALTHYVAPGYLNAMRMTLRGGRDFTSADTAGAPLVAIVNEAFARRYIRGRDPLAEILTFRGNPRVDRRIVGVVADAVHLNLRTPPPPAAYLPFAQMSGGAGFTGGTFAIRVSPSFGDVSSIRAAVAPFAPGPPVEIQSLTDQVERTLVQERLMALLAGAFAVLALVLAAVGLYGLLSYTVAQRTGELGIRTALGAEPRNVIALVMRDAGWMVAAGVALGLPLAWASSRLVRGMLFGLEPADPWNLTLALAVLVVAAWTAAWLPARRAARLDPVVALRAG